LISMHKPHPTTASTVHAVADPFSKTPAYFVWSPITQIFAEQSVRSFDHFLVAFMSVANQ
jgi:hypothetical protein